jgi:hypothetical protein
MVDVMAAVFDVIFDWLEWLLPCRGTGFFEEVCH